MKGLTLLLMLMLASSVSLTIVALLNNAAVASAPGKQIGAGQRRDSVAASKRAAHSEHHYGNERTLGGLGLTKDEEMKRLKLMMLLLMMSIGPRDAMR